MILPFKVEICCSRSLLVLPFLVNGDKGTNKDLVAQSLLRTVKCFVSTKHCPSEVTEILLLTLYFCEEVF